VSAVEYLILCVHINIRDSVCVCDLPAGMTHIPHGRYLDAIVARRFLPPPPWSPETILFPSLSKLCYDFEDDSLRPFQVEKLHRDYNSDVGMRVSARERRRERERGLR